MSTSEKMVNSYKSILNALNNPPEASISMLGGHKDSAEINERGAAKIMNERHLAIIAAGTECPRNCIKSLHNLKKITLTHKMCHDSLKMLRNKISFEKWIVLYKAFISDGYTDGDLERFMR